MTNKKAMMRVKGTGIITIFYTNSTAIHFYNCVLSLTLYMRCVLVCVCLCVCACLCRSVWVFLSNALSLGGNLNQRDKEWEGNNIFISHNINERRRVKSFWFMLQKLYHFLYTQLFGKQRVSAFSSFLSLVDFCRIEIHPFCIYITFLF